MPPQQEWEELRAALRALQEQQAGMAALLQKMAESSASTAAALQVWHACLRCSRAEGAWCIKSPGPIN